MPFSELPLYFENTAGQVREHPAGYGIVCYSPGRRQAGSFEALGAQVGQLLVARHWSRLLSDQRELTPLSEPEKAWVAAQWLPHKIARPSPLWEAILLSSDVFARLSIAQILNPTTAAGTITVRSFSDEAAAHAYLSGLAVP